MIKKDRNNKNSLKIKKSKNMSLTHVKFIHRIYLRNLSFFDCLMRTPLPENLALQ